MAGGLAKEFTQKAPPGLVFEDFLVGDELGAVEKGPMMVGHQVRWAGATDNYYHEFHHDEHVAKAAGLPGILLSGPFVGALMLAQVRHWFGLNATLRTFYDRNKGSTLPRDMLSIRGKVIGVEDLGSTGRVKIECWVENQRGEITTPGGAVAELPKRKGGA